MIDVLKSDLVPFIGFLIGAFSCYYWGGPIADRLIAWWANHVISKDRDKLGMKPDEEIQAVSEDLALPSGGSIGRLERTLFVLAVFYPALSLITLVIILKAFFGWLAEPKANPNRQMVYYHLYLGGNLLSVIVGVAFGFAGLFATHLLSALVK